MADYGEILLEAVQTVVDGSLSKLEFDKTITATIIDNSLADQGEYTVNDGSTSFTAYSENPNYSVDTKVYVNIPNGDFTKQKTITGKYLGAGSKEPYIYTTPWDKYIDITGNLVSVQEASIKANDPKISERFLVYNREISDTKSYEILGLQVDFKTLLDSLGATEGDYGLKIYLKTVIKNNGAEDVYKTHVAKLSTLDMIGNVYAFNTYYTQQKIFDISEMGEIISISVSLYQNNNFKDRNNNRLSEDQINNIFVNNIHLSLGYNIENFNDGKVLLYTLDSNTFDESYGEKGPENQKTLILKWIHQDPETQQIKVIEEISDLYDEAKIHWYKYDLTEAVEDEYSGVFWKEKNIWQDTFTNNINLYEETDNKEVKYKVIIEYPSSEYLEAELERNSDLIELKQNIENLEIEINSLIGDDSSIEISDEDEDDEEGGSYIDPSIFDQSAEEKTALLEEKQKELKNLQVSYDEMVQTYTTGSVLYESDVLEFVNESPVEDLTTIDLIQALSLDVDSNGSFALYGQNNQLQNNSEANKVRTLTAKYNSMITGEENLDTAESISWRFPLTGTMIQEPREGIEYDSSIDKVEYSKDGKYCTITRAVDPSETSIGEIYENAISQNFRIKSYYQASATNNTIFCYVVKNGKLYQTSTDMFFGPLGNSGTDFTLLSSMEDGRNCIFGEDSNPIRVNVSLYDFNNNEVPYCQNAEIEYSWHAQDDIIKVGFCDEDGYLYNENMNPIKEYTEDENGNIQDNLKIGEEKDFGNELKDGVDPSIRKDIEDLRGIKLLQSYIPEVITNQENHTHCYIRKLTDKEIISLNNLFDDSDLIKINEDDNLEYDEIMYDGISLSDDERIPFYTILKVSSRVSVPSKKEGDISSTLLTSYLPVPYSKNYNYTQIAGADKVTYDTLGSNPQYYKNNYTLYSNGVEVDGVQWSAINGATSVDENKFYPKIDSKGVLVPLSTYVTNLSTKIAALARNEFNDEILWVQPILIYQDVYTSTMLNTWDGSLTIDEENGTIMSTMLGAGYKDERNRFHGVLMGDVKGSGVDKIADTGIFGYHEGSQSFGFKTDGTAFIGKANRGQIQFDGNHGFIQSLSYKQGSTGMKIDLDDGVISMRGSEMSSIKKVKKAKEIQFIDIPNIKIPEEGSLKYEEYKPYIPIINSLKEYDKKRYDELTSQELSDIQDKIRTLQNFTGSFVLGEQSVKPVFNEQGEITYIVNESGEEKIVEYNKDGIPLYTKIYESYIPQYKGTSSVVRLASQSPYFQISVPFKRVTEEGEKLSQSSLLEISDSRYFLRSTDYSTKYNEGFELNLKEGTIKGYNFDLTAFKTVPGNSYLVPSLSNNNIDKSKNDEQNWSFSEKDEEGDNQSDSSIKDNSKQEQDDSQILISKNILYTESNIFGSLVIDSNVSDFPFKINSNNNVNELLKNTFSIGWDGSVKGTSAIFSKTSEIAGFTIDDNTIFKNSSFFISHDKGVKFNNIFYLDPSGTLKINNGGRKKMNSREYLIPGTLDNGTGITLTNGGYIFAYGGIKSYKSIEARDNLYGHKHLYVLNDVNSKDNPHYFKFGNSTSGVQIRMRRKNKELSLYSIKVDKNGAYDGSGPTFIDGKYIVDGTIDTKQIAGGAVTSGKIAGGAVTSDKIAGGAVTSGKIGDGAVTSDKIKNGTITNSDISSNANINWNKIDHPSVMHTGQGPSGGATLTVMTGLTSSKTLHIDSNGRITSIT